VHQSAPQIETIEEIDTAHHVRWPQPVVSASVHSLRVAGLLGPEELKLAISLGVPQSVAVIGVW